MSGEPLVAVLIPVYGAGEALRATLDSLCDGRLPARIATLIVDDGSEPPLEIDAARYPRLGLKLIRLPRNEGIAGALNRGLQAARELGAAYVARLDAGDTAHGDRLAKQLALLEREPEVGIVGSDVLFVDEAGRLLFRFVAPRSDRETRRRMHIACCLVHPAVMMRMSVLEAIGLYSQDYPAAEDYDFFFRLLARARAASIPEPLTTSVISTRGISLSRRRAQLSSKLRVQLKYFAFLRPQSYAGVALTALLALLPVRLLAWLKRRVGATRY